MGWFKKFIDEVKAEWNKQNTSTNEQTQSLFSEEQLQEIKRARQNTIDWCAKANYGVQKYGMPKIGNIVIHQWLKHNEDRTDFSFDELAKCKTMYFIVRDWIHDLEEYDEHGNRIRTEDEILRTYLSAMYGDLYRLQNILKENGIEIKESR